MTDFKDNIRIDKYSLDHEFEKHPMLYHEFAMDLQQAEGERDTIKDQFELLKAQLDSEIRTDPKKFKIEKITEAAITGAILQHIKFQIAQNKLNVATNNVRILKVAVDSLVQKKTALENLVKLYLGEYYSKEAPKEIKENMAERVSDLIHEERNEHGRLKRNVP